MYRDFISSDWFTISIVLVLMGFVFMKQFYENKFAQFVKLGFSDIYWTDKQKSRDFITGFEIIVFLLSHLVAAQLAYLILQNEGLLNSIDVYPFAIVSVLFIIFFLFSSLKYYFEKLVFTILNNSNFLHYYLFYKQVLWSYSLFLSIPFLILEVYSPYEEINFLSISLVVMGLYYVINLLVLGVKYRSIFIGNWFYFILYICTLEIAPYFFIYKILAV